MNLKEALVWICCVIPLYYAKIPINVLFSFQVYKYREHIFFLQQKFKQEGGTQPSSPMLDMPSAPAQGHNLSRLYGSTATQYINEMLLQGNAQPKFPGSPLPDGKKPGSGKHGDGSGKPWQYQQVSYVSSCQITWKRTFWNHWRQLEDHVLSFSAFWPTPTPRPD